MKNILLVSIISLFIVSCAYNKDELPQPNSGISGGSGGGTAPTVTYTSHAKAILDAKCAGCHNASSPQGGVPLVTYSNCFSKRTRIEARAIIQGTMPNNGSLPQTEKDTLQMWINQGALQ
jgi:uncharacterized membrane protein